MDDLGGNTPIFGNIFLNMAIFGINRSEKYARHIGSFPQGSGWKWKIFATTTQFKYGHFWYLYVKYGNPETLQ